MSRLDRASRPGIEPLEARSLCVSYAPALAPNHPVIRWRAVGGTAQDVGLVAAVLLDAQQGTSFRFVHTPNARRADYTVFFGASGLPISTGGSVRRFRGWGTAYTMTLPRGIGANPTHWISTVAHELTHALSLQHPGNGPASPPIGSLSGIPDEAARLRHYFRNLDEDDFAFQFYPRPGVAEVPGTLWDPRTVTEVNPFRSVAYAGVFSDADRLAFRILSARA